MGWELIRVEAYAGSRGGEEPRAPLDHGRRRTVTDVLDRWLGSSPHPTDSPQDYFRVRTDDGQVSLIRYDRTFGAWAIQR